MNNMKNNCTNKFINNLLTDLKAVTGFSLLFFLMLNIMLFQGGNAEAKQHRAILLDAYGNITDEHDGIHEDDSLALVAYYHSMQGDHWADNSGWLQDRVDFWVGVSGVQNVGTTEEPEWRVTRMTMPNHNMTRPGQFPVEMGMMEHLQRYEVAIGLISGGLENFEGLNRLERLSIRNHILTGEIPWVIFSELQSLERLEIRNSPQEASQNRMSGGIDPVVGNFPRIQRFHFSGAKLSGPIPAEIADIETLQHLSFHRNLFTGGWDQLSGLTELPDFSVFDFFENPFDPGPIPDWVCDFQELNQFRVWNTNRTGSVPECIADLPELSTLGFGEGMWVDEAAEHPHFQGENMIGGEIPDLSLMVNLNRLRIYGPGFTGEIPTWIADIPNLDRLYLVETGYEGGLPAALFTIEGLQRIYISNNPNLTGGLPAQMQTAVNLERILIFDNPGIEIGVLPDWISNLTTARELNLAGMGASGDIPDEWEELTSLEHLILRDNPGVTGTIPSWVQDRELLRLELDRTGMDIPEIPGWLAEQESLIRLGLAGLGMSGEIPDWLGDLFRITHLNLDDNALSGNIPDSMGDLFLMDSISLANNDFSGEIPESLADMGRYTDDATGLTYFSISGNENLTGPVPLGFADAQFAIKFEFAGTGLCEPEDTKFHDWLEAIPDNSYQTFPPMPSSVTRTNVPCDPTSVENPDLPNRLALHQNYPNPFNPSTTIKYEIPSDVHVTLNVYNVIGQRVVTLVDDVRSAGSYEVNFDAARIASGTYIYRLEAGDRSLTQTMMLMK